MNRFAKTAILAAASSRQLPHRLQQHRQIPGAVMVGIVVAGIVPTTATGIAAMATPSPQA